MLAAGRVAQCWQCGCWRTQVPQLQGLLAVLCWVAVRWERRPGDGVLFCKETDQSRLEEVVRAVQKVVLMKLRLGAVVMLDWWE